MGPKTKILSREIELSFLFQSIRLEEQKNLVYSFVKTRKVQENKNSFYFRQSHKKNISKNIVGSIYFSYLYLDRKHIFVVFMTMFRFIVPKLI